MLTLLGLCVVTIILGVVAFWFAGSVRRMEGTVAQQQAALGAVQTQVAAEAARGAKAQEAVQLAAQATVQAMNAKLAEEQGKTAAYSRIVRANQLANNALLELTQHPQAALLLAIESLRMQSENGEAPLAESVQRLRSILGATGGMPLRTDTETPALAVSSDERWVAAGDVSGSIHLWDLQDLNTAPRLLPGHEGPVFALVFGADNRTLYSAGADGTLRAWSWHQPATRPDAEAEAESVRSASHHGRHQHGARRAAVSPVRTGISAGRQPAGGGRRGRHGWALADRRGAGRWAHPKRPHRGSQHTGVQPRWAAAGERRERRLSAHLEQRGWRAAGGAGRR